MDAQPPNAEVKDRAGNAFSLVPWKCPICGPGPTKTLGLRGGSHHRHGLGIESTIVQCVRCKLIFPDPFPIPKSPQALYGDPDKYFVLHDLGQKIGWNRSLVRTAIERAERGTAARLLDVGSGRGEMLRAAEIEGLSSMVGLEFSQAMIDFTAKEFGLEVKKQSIEDHAKEHAGVYDIVIMNAVLEHVYDPASMITAVAIKAPLNFTTSFMSVFPVSAAGRGELKALSAVRCGVASIRKQSSIDQGGASRSLPRNTAAPDQ